MTSTSCLSDLNSGDKQPDHMFNHLGAAALLRAASGCLSSSKRSAEADTVIIDLLDREHKQLNRYMRNINTLTESGCRCDGDRVKRMTAVRREELLSESVDNIRLLNILSPD